MLRSEIHFRRRSCCKSIRELHEIAKQYGPFIILTILTTLFICSAVGVNKFCGNYEIAQCPQIDGVVTDVEQVGYKNATILQFDIIEHETAVARDYIQIIPATQMYEKNTTVNLHKKCYGDYEDGAKASNGYSFEKQFYNKSTDVEKCNTSVITIFLSGISLFAFSMFFGPLFESILKNLDDPPI